MPARDLAEFIAYAKKRAGALKMGSGGIGSTGHVSADLFRMMADIRLAHVPYPNNVVLDRA